MHLYTFKGLDKQGNILLQYHKFCTRPKATLTYKHLMELLERDKIDTVQVEKKQTYCSF